MLTTLLLMDEEPSGGTGDALVASKKHIFHASDLNGDQVTDLCMSMSADGA